MATPPNSQSKRDFIKVVCVIATILLVCAVFFVTPTLSTPTFLAIIAMMILSPWVASVQRRGIPRVFAIAIVFGSMMTLAGLGGLWITNSISTEWHSLKEQAPIYYSATIGRLSEMEGALKTKYPFLEGMSPTESAVRWVDESGSWLFTHGTGLVTDLATWLIIVPILTFFLLNEGKSLRKRFFALIPNRYFESTLMISTKILDSLSDYIRAKLIEAFLVAVMTTTGLMLVGAPYAVVLGVFAGVTNIIPYVGPIVGAIPGVMIAAYDPTRADLLWATAIVYAVANIVDLFFIFPIVVAKLVDLHPILLLAAVLAGQQYYGLIGTLISIPVASALKVIFQEIYSAVYQQSRTPQRRGPIFPFPN